MSIVKRILCSLSGKHSAIAFVRNLYGDEILEWGGNRSLWRCKHCNCISAWKYLNEPPKAPQPSEQPAIASWQIERDGLLRDLRMSTRVIQMQLQTIKELEAQIAAFSIPSQEVQP